MSIQSPLKEILHDYFHVEWIDEEQLLQDMSKPNWKYDREVFMIQLEKAIEEKTISPSDYFLVTGDELDEPNEVSEALQVIWNDLFN